MHIINDADDIEELPLPSLGSEGNIVMPKKLGRPKDKPNIPQLEKELIAIQANLGVNQKFLASVADTSQAEVSALSRGYTQTNVDTREVNEGVKLAGLTAKHKIISIAETKILSALGLFDPKALEQKDLPGAAAKLATVAEKFSGSTQVNQNNIQFNIYRPRPKSEEDFGEAIVLDEASS
jgi:hypothetical protein